MNQVVKKRWAKAVWKHKFDFIQFFNYFSKLLNIFFPLKIVHIIENIGEDFGSDTLEWMT